MSLLVLYTWCPVPIPLLPPLVIGMEKKVYSNSQTIEFSGNIGVNGNNFSMNYIRIQNTVLLRQQQQNMYVSFANIQLINNRTG